MKNEEVGDATKVSVSGPGLENGFANKINEFAIDTRNAGNHIIIGNLYWRSFIISFFRIRIT